MAESEYELMEWESESEAAERARGPKRPSSAPSFRPRPAPGTPSGVTQAQLEAALARVDGKIKTVADGVSQVSGRITTLSAMAKKEAEERKKGIDGQNKDLNQKVQMLALLPLLMQSPSKTLAAPLNLQGGGTVSTISVPDTSTLDSLLPLLLVSGLGTSTPSGSGGGGLFDGGSGDNGMMLLVLALALSKGNN